MTEVHDIRELYYDKGENITEIARETGHDRKTVRVYLEKDDWNKTQLGSTPDVAFPKLEP